MIRTRLCSLGLLLVVLPGLVHCRSKSGDPAALGAPPATSPEADAATSALDEATPDGGRERTSALALDAGSDGGPEEFRVDWCARLGAQESAAFEAASQIGVDYATAVIDDCRTAGLVDYMSEDQQFDWLYYLAEYTYYLAGCPPIYEVVEGGIDVFGPANLSSVQAKRPPLAASEADLLIDHYLQAFGDTLALSDSERSSVRAYLAALAAEEIDATATTTISTCLAPDAGSG